MRSTCYLLLDPLASLLHSGSRDPAFELPGGVLVSRTEEIRPPIA